MPDKTSENTPRVQGAYSAPKLYFGILPSVLLPVAAICCILLGLARLGVFGAPVMEIMKTGFFSNPIAIIAYIIILSAFGITALSCFVMSKIANYRRELVLDALETVKTGDINEENSPKLYKADGQFVQKLEAISRRLKETEENGEQLRQEASAAVADKDYLIFNILAAKASPAAVRRILAHMEKLSGEGRGEDAAKLGALLGSVLDSVLTENTQLVRMSSELGLVKDYLEMEKIVSGEDIAFRMSVMCSIVEYKLLPNVILPVVSNFVEYARRGERIGKYEISLELSVIKGRMVLILRDNGFGIDESELHRIRNQIETDNVDMLGNEITLPNINRRIKLYYGDDYGVKVSSTRLGTVVKLYMPVQSTELNN